MKNTAQDDSSDVTITGETANYFCSADTQQQPAHWLCFQNVTAITIKSKKKKKEEETKKRCSSSGHKIDDELIGSPHGPALNRATQLVCARLG